MKFFGFQLKFRSNNIVFTQHNNEMFLFPVNCKFTQECIVFISIARCMYKTEIKKKKNKVINQISTK